MRKIVILLLTVGLLAIPALIAWGQCGPNGCQQPQQYDGWGPAQVVREKTRSREVRRTPTPAWRYEKAVGHRAAVVRVMCFDGFNQRSIGSGVIVRWGKRIVVLTARHVVKDAKRVIIEDRKKKVHNVRVLKIDATWDCAVLGFDDPVDELDAAEVEMGNAAMFRGGERLESCGYGPDGQLASNSGLFRGYRRTTTMPNGPDDWMVISGRARGGDSGGPIFNSAGKVVGVLWGTDGQEVVGVQAGRLHVLLDTAVPPDVQLVEQKGILQRNPTPPKGDVECGPGGCGPGGCDADQASLRNKDKAADKKPLLPWRGEAEKSQNAQDKRIESLIDLIDRQQAQLQQQPPQVEQPPQKSQSEGLNSVALTWIVVLCALVGVGLAFFIRYGVVEKE